MVEQQMESESSPKYLILEKKCQELTSKCEQLYLNTLKSESKANTLTGYIQALKRTYASLVFSYIHSFIIVYRQSQINRIKEMSVPFLKCT